MEITGLTIGDMAALSKLYSQFWGEESDIKKMERKFQELQKNASYLFLGARENGDLIGAAMGIVCEELYGACEPFLVVEDMVVDKQHRKKGVGKLLFRALEAQAKSKGCAQVILVTEEARTDACAFYKSMGFHPTMHKGFKKKL